VVKGRHAYALFLTWQCSQARWRRGWAISSGPSPSPCCCCRRSGDDDECSWSGLASGGSERQEGPDPSPSSFKLARGKGFGAPEGGVNAKAGSTPPGRGSLGEWPGGAATDEKEEDKEEGRLGPAVSVGLLAVCHLSAAEASGFETVTTDRPLPSPVCVTTPCSRKARRLPPRGSGPEVDRERGGGGLPRVHKGRNDEIFLA
jgi:hypothetical protein